ncbi:hypothetical protein DV735_g346, partial [Chaetothyriales sp. CBS 134920]
MLSVNDHRRSRSKSPSGRDRDPSRSRSRSRSRDTRDTPDIGRDRSPGAETSRKERRSSTYDDGRYQEKGASDRRRYDEDDKTEPSDRRRLSQSSKVYPREVSVSDDDDARRDKSSRKAKKHVDDPDTDDRPRTSKSRKGNSKDDDSGSDSGGSDGHRSRHSERRKSKAESNYGPPSKGASTGYPPSSATYQSYQETRHMSYVGGDPRFAPPPTKYVQPPATKQRPGSFSGPVGYAEPEKFRYAQVDHSGHSYDTQRPRDAQYPEERERIRPEKRDSSSDRRRGGEQADNYNYEVRKPRQVKDYNDDNYDRNYREKKYTDDKYGSRVDDASRRLSNVALGGAAAATAAGAGLLGLSQATAPQGRGLPPPSPLLESYKGTYQSISPMPGALVLHQHKDDSDVSDFDMASDNDDGIDPRDPNADLKRKIKQLESEKAEYRIQRERANSRDEDARARRSSAATEIRPRNTEKEVTTRSRESRDDDGEVRYEIRAPRRRKDDSDSDDGSPLGRPLSKKGERKRVMFYDAEADAEKIALALEGTTRPPNVKPLIVILPGLSDDDVMALRLAYKNIAKISGIGINIAKHIKMRVPGNLGKACYATALGRWESEAYWANSWYQGGSTRRELLIESLMGRSNSDIREIKNCFKDKRYGDDLEQCMKAELKADKFRSAILLALQERRMPESAPVSKSLVNDDVVDLHRALTSAGGESVLIQTIVVRSDQHLRAFLRAFEATYNVNFARAMIQKSRNLVGETLAHILNGALNRPMRDAMLLHQAIAETGPGRERAELLISRLVRLHWEPKHMEKVKAQYKARYGRSVEADIANEVYANMKTDEGRQWAEFCVNLVRSSA